MPGTTVYGINKPTVAGDSGVWGGFLNTGMDTIDNEIARSRIPFVSPTYNVGGTTTLDLNQTTGGRVFKFTVSGASTLAFSNVPSSSFDARITLWITNGSAFVLSFPASVNWTAGIAPTLKASGVDLVDLETNDGGTTWQATLRNLRPGLLYQNQGLSTSSTTNVSIASYSLPANALSVNAQAIRVTVHGRAVTQAGTFFLKFGASTLMTITIAINDAFSYTAIIRRSGAATQFSHCYAFPGNAVAVAAQRFTPTETLSGAVVVDFQGRTNTAGGTLELNG